jgi:hypothetical protein
MFSAQPTLKPTAGRQRSRPLGGAGRLPAQAGPPPRDAGAGDDPGVINQWIAEATQQQRSAEAPAASSAGLDLADPQQRARLYQEMGITGVDQPALRVVTISADPDTRRPSVSVGGPTATLRLPALTTLIML